MSLYEKIIHPKLVKFCVLAAFFIFIPGLIIGVIIAALFGHQGYNIMNNWISDLGSFNFTPAPFILDTIAIVTSFLMVPVFLYMKDEFIKNSSANDPKAKEPLALKVVAYLGLFWLFVGDVGLFGIGLFSEDRSTALNLHMVFSVVVFGGFAIGALFTGIVIVVKETILSRPFGFFMIIGPPAATILFGINYIDRFMSTQFLEWTMLFAIFIWMIPLSFNLVRHLNEKLASIA